MDLCEQGTSPPGWTTPSDALGRTPPAQLAEPRERPSQGQALRFGFRVGSIGLLIASAVTGEVVERAPVYPVPNTAGWLLGIVNQRGNLVPVFDLAVILGEQPEPGPRERLLLVGSGADAVAFPIEALPRAVRPGGTVEPRPPVPSPFEPHTRGAYLVDGELWLDVDLEALLGSLAGQVSR